MQLRPPLLIVGNAYDAHALRGRPRVAEISGGEKRALPRFRLRDTQGRFDRHEILVR